MERNPVSGVRKVFILVTSAQLMVQPVNSAASKDILSGHASREKGHTKTRSPNTNML